MDVDVTDTSLDSAFLAIARRLVPGATSLRHHELGGGVSATVYGLEVSSPAGSQRLVVRRHGAAAWKQLPEGVTRTEFQLLEALHGASLPVPRPRLLDVSAELLPSPFFVMDLVEGSSEIASGSLDSALRQMAKFLARVHLLELTRFCLPALPIREDPVQGVLNYLPADFESARLREFVSSYQVHPYRTSLLHGDFWPGNVLWANDQLAAVIDWEDAALGPATSDVACCRAELNALFDASAARSFTDYYAAATPDSLHDLALWDLYVGSAALATLHKWGLPPEVEARRRERTLTFVAAAAEELLQSRVAGT